MQDVITDLKQALGGKMTDTPDERFDMIKMLNKSAEMGESLEKKHFMDYLENERDIIQIYNLIKNKKLSANEIKKKIKTYLKDPNHLETFLNSILETKKNKKKEPNEAMGAASAGGFSSPLFSTTKGDIVNTVKTVREQEETDLESNEKIKKVETKEATSVSSSGQYNQPSIWAKSMKKKDFRGYSKPLYKGGKFVQVKKKCKKFPYCNQGDVKALKIFENESVQNAIDSVSDRYGIDKSYISEIVFQEIRKRQ